MPCQSQLECHDWHSKVNCPMVLIRFSAEQMHRMSQDAGVTSALLIEGRW